MSGPDTSRKPLARAQVHLLGSSEESCVQAASRETSGSGQLPTSPLSQLFRTQYRQLVGFCRIRIRSESDAEDIVQSAFLAARQAYPDKEADELRPLLFTMVRNLSLNHVKHSWNRIRHRQDIADAASGMACPRTPTPEKQLMDAQDLAIVETVLAGMPERRREALRLHRFEGLTYDEIATRLSVGRTTVKNEIAQAVAEVTGALARAGRRTAGPAG